MAAHQCNADNMHADRQTMLEGAAINKSHLCFEECIRAMGKDARLIPYRGSTLTKVNLVDITILVRFCFGSHCFFRFCAIVSLGSAARLV